MAVGISKLGPSFVIVIMKGKNESGAKPTILMGDTARSIFIKQVNAN